LALVLLFATAPLFARAAESPNSSLDEARPTDQAASAIAFPHCSIWDIASSAAEPVSEVATMQELRVIILFD
jgi:hypothetical protein